MASMMHRMTRADIFSAGRSVFKDLDVVRVKRDIPSQQGIVPKGSTGTVLMSFKDGEAYEIEFIEPVEAMVAIKAGDLEPA